MISLKKQILLSATFALCTSSSAFALDADAFMERFQASMENNGAQFEYGAVELDGTTLTIEDAKILSANKPLPVGTLTFTNISEDENGGYLVGTATTEDINYDDEGVKFNLSDIEVTGLRIPGENTKDSLGSFLLYDSAKTGPALFHFKGLDVFKMSGSNFELTYSDDETSMTFDGAMDGLYIDLSSLKDPRAKAALSQMGYTTLAGDVRLNGDWNIETGQMRIPEYAITLNDVGRLNLAFDISGYDKNFIAQSQELQKEIAANKNDPNAAQAMGMASLSLMQQLSLNSMSIRFDDASLTSNVLAFVGSQQGMSAEQMSQAAKGILPFVLARLGMPELQQQIAEAASIYLDDPKNIEIKATPENPVSFGVIMGTGMADPRGIPELIGVEVIANQ